MTGTDGYAAAGVDTDEAGRAVAALVAVLGSIDTGRERLSVLDSGHYANVLRVTPDLGIAISTDGVGSKVIIAEQLGRFDTIGIDCVAMNVNDLICVGARPIALLDYIAVEQAETEMLRAIAIGLKTGAERAGVEIPGGELAQLPELIRGHPSPTGFDLVGTALGTVALDRMITGARIEPGNAVIGLPSSGVHSNGLTLARHALLELAGLSLDERPPELTRSVGEELLEPTEIYVRPVLDLIDSGLDVRGLAHLTSGGVLNLLRLEAAVGYEIDAPLPAPPIFDLIQRSGRIADAEMFDVFNMGCGFCCVVADDDRVAALELLHRHYPAAGQIGQATSDAGVVRVPSRSLVGRDGKLAPA